MRRRRKLVTIKFWATLRVFVFVQRMKSKDDTGET